MRCVQRRHPRMCGCAAVAVHSLAVQSEGAPHSAQREASAEGRLTVCVRSAVGLRVSLARRTSLYFCRELVLIPHRERSAAATPPPVCARRHLRTRSSAQAGGGISTEHLSDEKIDRGEHELNIPRTRVFSRESRVAPRPRSLVCPSVGARSLQCLGVGPPPPSPDTLPRPPVTPSSHEPSRAVGRGESCAERCVTQRFAGQ